MAVPTSSMPLPPAPALLDGGMGRELRFRGIDILTPSWSAAALLSAPEVVRAVHDDYLAAGAEIITTNTYGVVRSALAEEGIEHRFAEMNETACRIAAAARDAAPGPAWIAGSLPPLNGSYRADRVLPRETLEPLYREQAAILAPWVDFFLCETMSSIAEGLAAAAGASAGAGASGKPVWVAFTLHEDRSGRLRSGETIAEAARALAASGLPVTGLLANCCAPESVTAAMPALLASGLRWTGGYANTFEPVPETWSLSDGDPASRSLTLREDLDPAEYLAHASGWWEAGATVVGGCCGTRPAHIAAIAGAWERERDRRR